MTNESMRFKSPLTSVEARTLALLLTKYVDFCSVVYSSMPMPPNIAHILRGIAYDCAISAKLLDESRQFTTLEGMPAHVPDSL